MSIRNTIVANDNKVEKWAHIVPNLLRFIKHNQLVEGKYVSIRLPIHNANQYDMSLPWGFCQEAIITFEHSLLESLTPERISEEFEKEFHKIPHPAEAADGFSEVIDEAEDYEVMIHIIMCIVGPVVATRLQSSANQSVLFPKFPNHDRVLLETKTLTLVAVMNNLSYSDIRKIPSVTVSEYILMDHVPETFRSVYPNKLFRTYRELKSEFNIMVAPIDEKPYFIRHNKIDRFTDYERVVAALNGNTMDVNEVYAIHNIVKIAIKEKRI